MRLSLFYIYVDKFNQVKNIKFWKYHYDNAYLFKVLTIDNYAHEIKNIIYKFNYFSLSLNYGSITLVSLYFFLININGLVLSSSLACYYFSFYHYKHRINLILLIL